MEISLCFKFRFELGKSMEYSHGFTMLFCAFQFHSSKPHKLSLETSERWFVKIIENVIKVEPFK